MPTFVESDGPSVATHSLCSIGAADDAILAEVVQVDGQRLVLAPLEGRHAIAPGAEVRLVSEGSEINIGHRMFGRVFDGLGRGIDSHGPLVGDETRPLQGVRVSPLDRSARTSVLVTGIRAIDTLLPLAIGQRVGIFAGSGVGKSSLIVQMASTLEADRIVICLIGERGREAETLWNSLSEERRSRTALIVATSDQPAAVRIRAAYLALSLAEQQRDQGRHVLLLLDSVTRLAMAMRELGLAAGEPPTLRAYTPSVFAALPRLVERCGALKSGGAISAIMTVLTENDDAEDPLAEVMKSLLDGHILLSRDLAEQGHFPAIDVPRSVSRMSRELLDSKQQPLAAQAAAELSLYANSKLLVESGLYQSGNHAALDLAIAHRPALLSFLRQASSSFVARDDAFAALEIVLKEIA
jgi:flagellum-specific ATP synthase